MIKRESQNAIIKLHYQTDGEEQYLEDVSIKDKFLPNNQSNGHWILYRALIDDLQLQDLPVDLVFESWETAWLDEKLSYFPTGFQPIEIERKSKNFVVYRHCCWISTYNSELDADILFQYINELYTVATERMKSHGDIAVGYFSCYCDVRSYKEYVKINETSDTDYDVAEPYGSGYWEPDGPEVIGELHFVSFLIENQERSLERELTRVLAIEAQIDNATHKSLFLPYQNESNTMMQSVFISYGQPDETFATKLNQALKEHGIKTWFFPEDAVPGDRLHRMMWNGIKEHDRTILVCSKDSLKRNGVLNEIKHALNREIGMNEVIIPVRLDDFLFSWNPEEDALQEVVDELRARVVADFRNTVEDGQNEKFQKEFDKLLKALEPSSSI